MFSDFARCVHIMEKRVGRAYGRSCMYDPELPPVKHNWMQLGWLIDWVLVDDDENEKRHYHKRTALHNSLSQSITLRQLLTGNVHKSALVGHSLFVFTWATKVIRCVCVCVCLGTLFVLPGLCN